MHHVWIADKMDWHFFFYTPTPRDRFMLFFHSLFSHFNPYVCVFVRVNVYKILSVLHTMMYIGLAFKH